MIHIPRLQMKNILHYLMLPGTIQTSTNITNDVVIIGNPSFQVDFLEPTLLLQDGPCKCTGRRVSKCKCFSHQRSRQSPARDEAPANSRAGTRYKCKRNHENYCARYTSLIYIFVENLLLNAFVRKFTVQWGKRLPAVSSKWHSWISSTFCPFPHPISLCFAMI